MPGLMGNRQGHKYKPSPKESLEMQNVRGNVLARHSGEGLWGGLTLS